MSAPKGWKRDALVHFGAFLGVCALGAVFVIWSGISTAQAEEDARDARARKGVSANRAMPFPTYYEAVNHAIESQGLGNVQYFSDETDSILITSKHCDDMRAMFAPGGEMDMPDGTTVTCRSRTGPRVGTIWALDRR